jgi:hypothetical protein
VSARENLAALAVTGDLNGVYESDFAYVVSGG